MKETTFFCDGCRLKIEHPVKARVVGTSTIPEMETIWYEERELCGGCAEVLIMKLSRMAGAEALTALAEVEGQWPEV